MCNAEHALSDLTLSLAGHPVIRITASNDIFIWSYLVEKDAVFCSEFKQLLFGPNRVHTRSSDPPSDPIPVISSASKEIRFCYHQVEYVAFLLEGSSRAYGRDEEDPYQLFAALQDWVDHAKTVLSGGTS